MTKTTDLNELEEIETSADDIHLSDVVKESKKESKACKQLIDESDEFERMMGEE